MNNNLSRLQQGDVRGMPPRRSGRNKREEPGDGGAVDGERMVRALKRAKAAGIIEISTGSSTSNTGLDWKRCRDVLATAEFSTRGGGGAVVASSAHPMQVEQAASGAEEEADDEGGAPPRPATATRNATAAAAITATATTTTKIPATVQRRMKSVSFDDTNPRIKVRIGHGRARVIRGLDRTPCMA